MMFPQVLKFTEDYEIFEKINQHKKQGVSLSLVIDALVCGSVDNTDK